MIVFACIGLAILLVLGFFFLLFLLGMLSVVFGESEKDRKQREHEEARAAKVEEWAASLGVDGQLLFEKQVPLPPGGREFFTARLVAGQVYRIVLEGCVAYQHWGLKVADAFYQTDHQGNFTEPHALLNIDGRPLKSMPHQVVLHSRARHRYEVLVDGTGEELSLRFDLNEEQFPIGPGIWFTIDPVDVTSVNLVHREAKNAEAAAEFERKVQTAVFLTEPLANWSDPIFRSNQAVGHRDQLIAEGSRIVGDLFRLYDDQPEVMAALGARYPEALERLTGKFQALLEAQRLEGEDAAQRAQAASRPRLKPTVDEFRARLLAREQVAAADKRGFMRVALENRERERALLREYGFDEDEVDGMLGPANETVEEALARLTRRGRGGKDEQVTKLG